MAGMGVVLATSALACTALVLAGAGCLIYLGIKQWRSQASALSAEDSARHQRGGRFFAQGVSVALANPKGILIFRLCVLRDWKCQVSAGCFDRQQLYACRESRCRWIRSFWALWLEIATHRQRSTPNPSFVPARNQRQLYE